MIAEDVTLPSAAETPHAGYERLDQSTEPEQHTEDSDAAPAATQGNVPQPTAPAAAEADGPAQSTPQSGFCHEPEYGSVDMIPAIKNLKEGGRFQRQMPESIYSAVIIGWLTLNSAAFQPAPQWRRLAHVFYGALLAALAGSIVLQLGFAFYLYRAVHGDADGDERALSDCTASSFTLRTLALSAYVGLVVNDLFQTYEMHRWLRLFPTASTMAEYLLLDQQSFKYYIPHPRPRPGMSEEQRWVAMEETRIVTLSGFTRAERLAFYALSLAPKLLTTLAVLVAGSGAVLRSADDFDVVLNATAATFILELDDAMYALLVPEQLKRVCGQVPPISASRFYEKSYACGADGVLRRMGGFHPLSKEQQLQQEEEEEWEHTQSVLHPYLIFLLVLLLDVVMYVLVWC
jgi:energy-converting hydrogenase Eha subunit G